MNKLKSFIMILFASVCFVAAISPLAQAYDPFASCGTDCANVSDDSLAPNSGTFKGKNIINTALMILGGIAVIVVVVGAFQIVVSNGDTNQVKNGRQAILFAVVGLAIALSAYIIVNFVANIEW